MKARQVCFLNFWSRVANGQRQWVMVIVAASRSRARSPSLTSPGHGVVWPFVVAGEKKPRNNMFGTLVAQDSDCSLTFLPPEVICDIPFSI